MPRWRGGQRTLFAGFKLRCIREVAALNNCSAENIEKSTYCPFPGAN